MKLWSKTCRLRFIIINTKMQEHEPMEEERKEPVNFGRFSSIHTPLYSLLAGQKCSARLRSANRRLHSLSKILHHQNCQAERRHAIQIRQQDQIQPQRYYRGQSRRQKGSSGCLVYLWEVLGFCQRVQIQPVHQARTCILSLIQKLRARFQAVKKFRRAFQWS